METVTFSNEQVLIFAKTIADELSGRIPVAAPELTTATAPAPTEDIPFYKLLQTRMSERGMSPTELSRVSGISKQSLSGYLNGKNIPKREQLARIVAALGCSEDEFYRALPAKRTAKPIAVKLKRITPEKLAPYIGRSPQSIRRLLISGVEWGRAGWGAGTRREYYIYPAKVMELFGVDFGEVG